MKRFSLKKFLLVNLPAFTTTAEVVEILKEDCWIRDVRVQHDPSTKVSHFYAFIRLHESIRSYYLPTFLENIRRKTLRDSPIFLIPVFMTKPLEVNRIFDTICQITSPGDLDGFRKAEMLSYELAAMEKRVRCVGADQLIKILTKSSVDGNLDIHSVEEQIRDFLNTEQQKEKFEPKPKPKKKRKKRRSCSVKAISIPMGGQPGWRRR